MTEFEKQILHDDIKKGFGLVEKGFYKIGDFIVTHESVEARLIIVTLVLGFIAGVLATALFNWIF